MLASCIRYRCSMKTSRKAIIKIRSITSSRVSELSNWAYIFNFFNHFLRLRITDEGSIPEMRIWTITLIKSDLKWCIHLSRRLFINFNYLVSVTAGGPRSPRGHM